MCVCVCVCVCVRECVYVSVYECVRECVCGTDPVHPAKLSSEVNVLRDGETKQGYPP